MSLWTDIFEFFHPCFHNWERVVELKDRPENPSAVTIVLICADCGKMRQETFKAPMGSWVCPPHRWVTTRTISVMKDGKKDGLPIYYDHEQKCAECGELRVKRL